jgi:cellulose synthase/poly-beta-1,6-N-acetylglucosamine synthase-like glycosyltransferase
VVVCTRDRPELLDRSLEAIGRLRYAPLQTLVVENAAVQGAARDIARRRGARFILEPRPGLSRARNTGARASDTPIVAFTDDDAVPDPDWLDQLVPGFADPAVVVVTGRILPLHVKTKAEHLFEDLGGFDNGTRPRRVDRHTPHWFEMACFGGLGNGANMAFRRAIFDVWPGFDERLGPGASLGGEESHAFFRLIERGHALIYTPHAIVRHPFPSTMDDLRLRHLRQLADATGYFTLLFAEHPPFRRVLMRYVLQAAARTPRSWRPPRRGPAPRLVPGWRRWLAMLAGPLLYARLRTTGTGGGRGRR